MNLYTTVFGVNTYIVVEDDLTKINSIYEYKNYTYNIDALTKLFFPSKSDKVATVLDHLTVSEWKFLMKKFVVLETEEHLGRRYRYPRLLVDLTIEQYKYTFETLKKRKGTALISGNFIINFAKTYLVILRVFL